MGRYGRDPDETYRDLLVALFHPDVDDRPLDYLRERKERDRHAR